MSASVTDFEKSMAGMEKTLGRTGAKLQTIGGDLTRGLTLPLVAIGGISVKAAMDFESSFAGIRKTVDGVVDAGGNLTTFGKDLQMQMRALATEIPVSVNELNRIGESAGQLGIRGDSIISFTKTIAAMGVATNLSTEQAADGMARFANIMQMPQTNIQNLGSVIVELGNKLAATESEILEFGLRIAGAGEIVGIAEAQILGIAGAFASVGIEAEAGGTAVQKALLAMNSAVASGDAKQFGAALGLSGAGFSKLFTDDPGEAFTRFVEGVGAAGKQGEVLLRGVGIDDARQIRAFLSLASAGDLLRNSLKLASDEWVRNTALAREAEQRYRTFESQVTLLKNQAQDLAITFGTSLIQSIQRLWPQIEKLVTGAAGLVEWFSRLSPGMQGAVFAMGAFAAALGPVVYLVGTFMKVGAGVAGLLRLITGTAVTSGATAATAATGWRAYWLAAAGPVGLGVAAAGAGVGLGMLAVRDIKRIASLSGTPLDTQRPGLTGPQRAGDVALAADPVTEMLKQLSKVQPNLSAFSADATKAAEATAKLAREYNALMSETRNAQGQFLFDMDAAFFNAPTSDATKNLQKMLMGSDVRPTDLLVPEMQRQLNALETTIIPGFKLGEAVAVAMTPPPSLLKSGFNKALAGMPQTIMAALTGGGSVGRSVGGLLGGELIGSFAGKLAGGLSSVLGSTLGAAIGSVIPGIGSMVGSMVGPLIVKGIKSDKAWVRALTGAIAGPVGAIAAVIFGGRGPSQQELEGRDAATQFRTQVESMLTDSQRLEVGADKWALSLVGVRDAYLATGRTAEQATMDMHRLWEAEKGGAEAVKRVIDEINLAFQEQAADTERLNAAIQKYGFSIEELGPKFRQQQLNDQAKELIEDWRVLVASGIDLSVVNTHMADTFNQYLATAIKAGVEVPGALRPILESLANQGVLLDGNGNKITDLNASGIVFSETMTQGFDRVVIKLQQLIDTLQGTGIAINDLPTSYTLDVKLRNLDQVNAQIQDIRDGMTLWERITGGSESQQLTDLLAQRDLLNQQIAAGQMTTASDTTGAATGPPVVIQADTIIGNVDALAVAMADGIAGGGEPFSVWRQLTGQLAT